MTSHDPADFILIGVDGGATEVKAHRVLFEESVGTQGTAQRAAGFSLRVVDSLFELGSESSSKHYEMVPDFKPLPVGEQISRRDAGNLELSELERQQGAKWIEAAASVTAEVATCAGGQCVLVGMGMPGLKTADQRGIAVINNGPRMPDYLARFEQQLSAHGVKLVAPVARLGSDADYCGLGEQFAAQGMLRDVTNAYYVGCGTGIADAMKLKNHLVTFDESRSWIQKSWQISSAIGPTFEKLVSARSMNEGYGRLTGTSESTAHRYPEVDAAAGQPLAIAWMDSVAMVLAELIFERLDTIHHGRRHLAWRGEAYLKLDPNHPYRGTWLDRVVIGQRMGQIYDRPDCRVVFRDKLDQYLAGLIIDSGGQPMMDRYLDGNKLHSGFVCASRLRAAPAIGAAVAAVMDRIAHRQ